jgi:uncharacterized protein (TIGR04255 family)
MTLPDELYVNSPLRSVVFEIRFPGEPAVECHRDRFFERVRSEFPQVFVPNVTEGTAVALSPYHFTSADNSRSLLTALNLFAFRTEAYPGYTSFREEVLRWIGEFTATFPLSHLTRTGLRYTNVIPFAPGSGFPLARFLQIAVALADKPVNDFSKFFMAAEIPTASGSLTLRVGIAPGEHGSEGILLDFDFARTNNLTIADIDGILDESHAATKQLFESLLSGEYRGYLRGEVLK